MLIPELKTIYGRYLNELKPLIAEYESRNEDFVAPLLLDMPDMFDCIALYSDSTSPLEKEEYMEQADAALDRAIASLHTCLVANMIENVKQFKSYYSEAILMTLQEGKFFKKFIDLEDEARSLKDSNRAKAYTILKEMDAMIASCHASSLVSRLLVENRVITRLKWIVTILVSLIVNALILYLL